MLDCVFNQRLDQQGRNLAFLTVRVYVLDDPQALPETDSLYFQIRFGQGQFFTEGNAEPFAKAQRTAQEFGEAYAHFPRLGWIDAGQCADGVQAVKEKV